MDENTSTQGVAYDYLSVMHPTSFAFSKGRYKTIVPLNFTGHLSGAQHHSARDIFHLNIMFCKGNEYTCMQLSICICNCNKLYYSIVLGLMLNYHAQLILQQV